MALQNSPILIYFYKNGHVIIDMAEYNGRVLANVLAFDFRFRGQCHRGQTPVTCMFPLGVCAWLAWVYVMAYRYTCTGTRVLE